MGRMSVKLLIFSGLLSALLLLNPAVLAVGLGSVEVETRLNEPLRAQIPLQSVSGINADEIEVSLGSPEEFSRVGIDRPAVLTQLSFELERTSRGPVIRVSSDEAISEPFLSFLVRVSWPQGRLLREYTILLDPPVTAPAAAPQPDQAPSQVVERDRPADTGAPDREETAGPGADGAPPGAAGERDAAAPTGGGSYGPVASGETLWSIADRLRPDSSVSVNQMMLALLRTNPDAFFRDNINALRRGAVLRVPDRDQIRNLDGSEALQAVRRQNELWQDHRRQLAEEAPTVVAGGEPQERAPVDEGSGDGESGLELVPPREGEAEESAATSGPGSDEVEADREALREELARTREDLLARREENTELDGRVDELEAQVERLQRLLELKNEELAALQQAEGPAGDESDPAGEEPAPEDAPAAADTGPDATEAPDEGDAPQEAAEDPADAPPVAEAPDTAGEEPEPGAEPATETQEETEAEEEPEPAAPPPPPGGGWMELLLSPVVLGIAGLLLIGIGVALFLHRRGDGEPELTVQRESLAERMTHREKPVEEEEETAAGADDTEFGPPESGPADYDEPALRAALEENPEDTETRLKLIRHYAAAGDRESFIAQAETLYADLADPASPAWLETRELGEEIAPDHELFGGSGEDIRSAVTGEQETVAGPAADRPEDAEPAGEAAELSGEQASGEELPDLDFETPAPEEPAPEEPRAEHEPREETGPETPGDEDQGFDLSGLDLGEREETTAGEPESPATGAGEEAPSKSPEREDAADDTFDSGDTAESRGTGEDEQEPLEFDLSDFEMEDEGDAGAGTETDDWMTEPEDESDRFDSSESEPETAGSETVPDLGEDTGGATAPGPEEEAGEEAAPEGGDDDAVNTKLELAEAYMDMSDEEGAREMLEEVLSEGDEGQQKRAREMLDKLS